MKYFFLIILFNFLPQNPMAKAVYNMKDLEALHNSMETKEFLVHAKDIKPSERNKKWEIMLVKQASLYAKQLLKDLSIIDSNYFFIKELSGWSKLRTNKDFTFWRNKFFAHYFTTCNKAQICEQRLKSISSLFSFPSQIALNLLKTYSKKLSLEAKWTLAKNITLSANSGQFCKERSIKSLSLAYILSKKPSHAENPTYTKHIQKIDFANNFNKNCLDELTPYWVSQLSVLKTSDSEFLFLAMETNNYLNEEEKAKFLTFYLLNGPKKGDIFNLAWKEIEKISQSSSLRLKVLDSLKTRTYLPGSIFRQNKSSAIVKHLNTFFPEYLDHYARTCLSFYQGTKEFKKGNPTIDCSNFIKLSKQINFLPVNLKQKINGLNI